MKNNKGITISSLIITIIIILILTTIVVTNTYTGSDYKKYKLMCTDVELLEDKILIFYNKYGELPLIDQGGQVLITDMPENLANQLERRTWILEN